ncbi:MAG TPA: hypothetical protein PLL69_03270 [Gemmatimonadales bacterium]|nr:hypothetical protein [Gemmatimonadales bacterium]
MIRGALLGLLLVAGGPLAAQSATGRWSLQIRGAALFDRGDLRIDGAAGRLALETADSAWLPIGDISQSDSRITFTAGGGREFRGTIDRDTMQGELLVGGVAAGHWEARRIQPGSETWPVRPRLVIGQLITGSSDTLVRFPEPWLAAAARHDLVDEYRDMSERAGIDTVAVNRLLVAGQRRMLGLDGDGRQLAAQVLELAAASPAADAAFRGLFRTADGGWRVDLHQVAWQLAESSNNRPVSLDRLLTGLSAAGSTVDSANVFEVVWRFWARTRGANARDELVRSIAHLPPDTQAEVRTLLSSYDIAEQWWTSAVRWLMESRWISTASGWQSPVELVRRFWDLDTLSLPRIEPRHFGAVQATPVLGAGPVIDQLLRPANITAAEWLRSREHRSAAIEAWRRLDFQGGRMPSVRVGSNSMAIASALEVTRSRLGGFVSADAAIRIEPSIIPVFAVGTLVHEWQHLLLEGARMHADPPAAFHASPWGIVLVESDPWLTEGSAEWATGVVLAPAMSHAPVFAAIEAEKRLAISSRSPDDPHAIGYLLVRAARDRVKSDAAMRDLLVRHVHDPAALAVEVGLDGPAGRGFARPATMAVIPETTFTFDGGLADEPSRRLVIPETIPEP